MISMQYALRRRMMVSGSNDMASLTPADGVTYTSGLDGLTAAEVSAISALISNEPTITKDTLTVYVDCGKIHRKLDVANQIALSLNGTNYTFDIIGFNHDTLTTATAYGEATATGKAGITLQMHDLFDTEYKMDGTATSQNGWRGSTMRTSTMVTMKSYLPDDWESVIKPVNKATSAGYKSTTIETVSDSCFLLAEIEIFGSLKYSVSGEGSQYAYYASGDIYRRGKKRPSAQYTGGWWERSPRSNQYYYYCVVSSSGTTHYLDASSTCGVSFAFCV